MQPQPPFRSLSYELHISLGLERESNAVPDERMVIDTENPDATGFVHRAPPEEFQLLIQRKKS
jgi:hypothetical protein